MEKFILINLLLAAMVLSGCSISKQISKQAKSDVFSNPAFVSAQTGISIYEPATGKYWYNFQGEKYFVPASNTKLPTCYAAMKYLGDSLVAFSYYETGDTLFVTPNGDPTFLHPEYLIQAGYNFLSNSKKPIAINTSGWKEQRWGSGWSWDDYSDYYAAERSAMPVYGNIVQIKNRLNDYVIMPSFFKNNVQIANTVDRSLFPQAVHRELAENSFTVTASGETEHYTETPFYASNPLLQQLLADTLHKSVVTNNQSVQSNGEQQIIHSQPTDSMLKPLMHRSDNFFAEQTLLMVSNKLLGVMSDEMIIDTLLKTDFKNLPQKPYWVDGSGLSHYNLFSPKDFVMILNKMRNDFGMDRIKNILATGGTGTIRNFYKADSGFIYVKTGTLSGVVALSGFLYTKKNKLLIFSTLVNNHHSSSTEIRKGIEKFIQEIRDKN